MARGKQTCRILKEIRRQIAAANDIEFITSECRYQGDCLGTCPKCEAEVRYLEQQLSNRRLMGKAVVLAGLSAGMIAMSGCGSPSPQKVENTDPLQGEPDTEMLKCKIAPDSAVTEETEPVDSVDNSTKIKYTEVAIVGGVDFEEPMCHEDSIDMQGEDSQSSQDIVVTTLPGEAVVHGEVDVDSFPDVQPLFPGGDAALIKWISKNLIYPQEAYENKIQGIVIAQFIVDEDGSIKDAEIIRSKSPELDEEALRLVHSLPRFIPAMWNGEPVKSEFVLPIKFKIDE